MTDLEKLLVTALRDAWDVLNAIRARDGAPYHRDDGMPYFDPAYFDTLVEECDAAIEAATGEMPKPWGFPWQLNETDSAAFVDALLNPPEPNEALRKAAEIFRRRTTYPERTMTEAQIKHMVGRFLNWRLPENFNPDGGVSFQRIGNEGTPHAYTREPSGTNLLDGVQAEAMIRHIIDGMPE